MKIRDILGLLLLAAMWGPSFLFIKVAVAEIPPVTLVLGRLIFGATLLLLLLYAGGGRLPKWGPIWKHLAFIAFIHSALPFVLFSWSEQFIDSGLASILNGMTPLFTVVLAHFLTVDDRLTVTKSVGVLLGFVGLLILVLPLLTDGVRATTLGILATTAAAACYAIAIVYAALYLRKLPPLVAPTAQITLAALYLLPISFWLERPYSLPMPSTAAVGAMLALGILGTGLGFVTYYRLVETMPPTSIAMVTYLLPVIGVILGVLLLNEQLTWHTYLGGALILFGVMIVNGLFKGIARHRLGCLVGVRPSKGAIGH